MTRSVVNYGAKENELTTLAEEPTLTFEHKVTIAGLTPRTKYYYAIGGGRGDTLQKGSDNYFVTLPFLVPKAVIALAFLAIAATSP